MGRSVRPVQLAVQLAVHDKCMISALSVHVHYQCMETADSRAVAGMHWSVAAITKGCNLIWESVFVVNLHHVYCHTCWSL
jgi:hypothetical protein